MGSIHNGVPQWIALAIKDRFEVKLFLETGLLHGNTALWATQHFEHVVSIEKHKSYCVNFRKNHPEDIVRVINEDSSKVIDLILAQYTSLNALIWLDAHWGADLHYKLRDKDAACPVLDEITQVNRYAKKHPFNDLYILVDDARLFGNEKDWPELSQVCEALRKPNRHISIIEDVIIAAPSDKADEMNNILTAHNE